MIEGKLYIDRNIGIRLAFRLQMVFEVLKRRLHHSRRKKQRGRE